MKRINELTKITKLEFKYVLKNIPIIIVNVQSEFKKTLFNLHHIFTIDDFYFRYLIFLTLPLKTSHKKRLSSLSTHKPYGYLRSQFSI